LKLWKGVDLLLDRKKPYEGTFKQIKQELGERIPEKGGEGFRTLKFIERHPKPQSLIRKRK